MGNCFGWCFGGKDKPENHIKELKTPLTEKQAKLDPKDFIVSKKVGEVIIREPGSVDGQQFVIEECNDCDIYIMDNSAAVSIDYCVGCRIFVGPCESSVFVRNCDGCSLVVAAAQFRTTECKDLRLLLLSPTAPSIETTTLSVGCFDFYYDALATQCRAAKVSPWSNNWSQVHNYTPGEYNFKLLPSSTRSSDLLRPLPEDVAARVGFSNEKWTVPHTTGSSKQRIPNNVCFMIVFGGYASRAVDLVQKVKSQPGGPLLLQSKVMPLATDMMDALFGGDEEARLASRAGQVLGLEWSGPSAIRKVGGVVDSMDFPPNAVYVWSNLEKSKLSASQFFDLWKSEM